jgi:hypothetical protein
MVERTPADTRLSEADLKSTWFLFFSISTLYNELMNQALLPWGLEGMNLRNK